MINAVMGALGMGLAMGWEILWPLILGFALSGVVQAAVSHQQMSQLLPDDRPRSIATALALGAASSSCSYAAVALARSIFRKGAHFTAAMAFEMASTNLVLELTIIMVALLGWQLTLAEFFGAPLMVVLLVLLSRMFLNQELLEQARKQADKGIAGRMEGHAEMDMSVTEGGSLWHRMTSERGFTAISHYFVMDWAAVWLDIAGGLLIGLLYVDGTVLVGEGRIAGDDEQGRIARQGGDYVLGDPVREELLLWVAAHIGEGQHRNRRLVGQRKGGLVGDHCSASPICRNAENPDGTLNVLQLPLAQVFESQIELA
jgi:hypothetical protein